MAPHTGLPQAGLIKRETAAPSYCRDTGAYKLLGVADPDGLHRVLGLDAGLVDDPVAADDGVLGRHRLLVDDRALLRLDILHDVKAFDLRERRHRKAQGNRPGENCLQHYVSLFESVVLKPGTSRRRTRFPGPARQPRAK